MTSDNVSEYDCVLVSTAHRDFKYALVKEHANLIVDTRNVFQTVGNHDGRIFKA